MIQAGINPTAKQVEANIEAIDATGGISKLTGRVPPPTRRRLRPSRPRSRP